MLVGVAAFAGGVYLWNRYKQNQVAQQTYSNRYMNDYNTPDSVRQGVRDMSNTARDVRESVDDAARDVARTARRVKEDVRDDIHRATR
jgi:hypothetical protein